MKVSRVWPLVALIFELLTCEVAFVSQVARAVLLPEYYRQSDALSSTEPDEEQARCWASAKGRYEEEGLTNLNISQCTALTPPAVQALCDSFPALHTCAGRHSLIIIGCLNSTSVHCACAHTPCLILHIVWVGT